MSTKTTCVAQVESLSHEGRGVARVDERIVFLDNALPGEEVEFTYLRRKSKYAVGVAVNILGAHSAVRVAPICQHYHICGGCSLQHLQPSEQLTLKSRTLLEHLQHIGGATVTQIDTQLSGPTQHYRNKARLSVKYVEKKNDLLIGFHEKAGMYVNPTIECPILNAKFSPVSRLKELLLSLSIYKAIPQLELACGSDTAALVLRHLEPFNAEDLQLLHQFGSEQGIKIYGQAGGIETVKFLGGVERVLSYRLDNLSLELLFEPTDFTQINATINQKLVDLVLHRLDCNSDETVLDLFCGIGNFTLPLARYCQTIIGVEGNPSAVTRAKRNASLNKITNVDFYVANLEEQFQDTVWWNRAYDKVVIDPPRLGAEKICQVLAQLKAKKIVYVSCNTATLARDIKILTQQGYRLSYTAIADMYPHTRHSEAVVELVRA